jgi:hypothetical protein
MKIGTTTPNGAAHAGGNSVNGGVQNDSYTREIRRKIANAQKKLQSLSANKNLSAEEKMKKRKEIQQEIANLNQQLRQHQIEQRKEQQNNQASSAAGGDSETGAQESGLTQTNMKAMISADLSLKQADVQKGVAAEMKSKARILKAEIRQESGKTSREKKQQELAQAEEKAQTAEASQMSNLTSISEKLKSTEDKKEKEREDEEAAKAREREKAGYKTVDVRL